MIWYVRYRRSRVGGTVWLFAPIVEGPKWEPLAKAAYKWAANAARAQGIIRIKTDNEVHNPMLALNRSLGFIITSRHAEFQGDMPELSW